MRVVGPGLRLSFQRQTTSQLADFLSTLLSVGRPVIDRTGLSAAYDFTLDLREAAPPGETDAGSAVSVALQQQLGLKLEGRKAPLEIMVIDRAERVPAGN